MSERLARCEALLNKYFHSAMCVCTDSTCDTCVLYDEFNAYYAKRIDCPCQRWASMDLSYLQSNGTRHHPECNGKGERRDGWSPFKPTVNYSSHDPNAQSILVIDLGDQCVVRIELGIFNDIWKLFCRSGHEHTSTLMINETFSDVRKAIDGEKPVPRLDGEYACFRLWDTDGIDTELHQRQISAIESLTGTKMPINIVGRWEQLGTLPELIRVPDVHPNQDIKAFGDVLGYVKPLPFKVWRYTR